MKILETMKILHITTNYPTSCNPVFGVFMKEQVDSLEKYGVENTIFFSNGSETQNRYFGGRLIHATSIVKLMFHLMTHRYDVIHCHSVISGMIFLYSGWRLFNKCVVSLQNDPSRGFDGSRFEQYKKKFDYVIIKANTVPIEGNVIYLPNGCNIDIFKPLDKNECKKRLGLDSHKRYILFVDSNTLKKRMQKRKDRFDETMHILREKYGHNDIEELDMIGVARNDVPTWINACDLHLLSSDQEGSPNSVKECLACNIPVVSTDVGNVRDLLDGLKDCFVSDHKEASELAELTDMVLRKQAHEGIRDAFIKKGFDMESTAKKIVSIYQSLIKHE